MGICVAQGQVKAGANQYSFLERRGAHNASGAALGAENTDVHRPASAFAEFTDQQRGEGWMDGSREGPDRGELSNGVILQGIQRLNNSSGRQGEKHSQNLFLYNLRIKTSPSQEAGL